MSRATTAADSRRASLALLGSAALFAVMAVGARALSARIPGAQTALIRFALGVLAVAGAASVGRAQIRPRRWGWLAARGLFGGLAVLAYFACIQHVGVGLATLLNYTAPVWSLLLSWALLGERPRAQVVAALVLTVAGVILVVGDAGSLRVGLWQLVGVLSAVASGIAVTSIRAVRRAGPDAVESSWTVFASFTGLGVLATGPFVVGRWVPPTATEWAILVVVAAASIAAQLIMTRSLMHVTAASTGIIHQLTVVLALLAGLLFFGEVLSLRAALGSFVTVAGVVWAVVGGTPLASPRAGR